MKKYAVVLIHLLLWALIFVTFINIIQGIHKSPDFDLSKQSGLIAGTFSTMLMLAVPFYSGYIVAPYLFDKQKRKLVITAVVLFGLFYPLALSLADDGLRLSTIRQFFFAFAFLNLFMILGMGVKSLLDRLAQKQ